MLAEERFALILEQLNEKRTVTVQQLCEALHTSESTIRRDLTELDRQADQGARGSYPAGQPFSGRRAHHGSQGNTGCGRKAQHCRGGRSAHHR